MADKTANRRINIFINDKDAGKTLKAIQKEARVLNNEINRNLIPGTEEYFKAVQRLAELRGTLSNHRQQLKSVAGAYNELEKESGGFKLSLMDLAGLTVAAFGTGAIIEYGKQLFAAGVQMDTLGRKAETVLGPSLAFVTAEAEKNAAAMGLTTGQYISATTAIADLLIPMGFQREQAAEISTELVNLSGALSEWTGGQRSATEVSEILNKALLGEREELKGLGISISEADVQARLAADGLDKLTGKALEQAKATTTLNLIMEKSVDAQTAFAENSDSLIRRQSELTARIQTVVDRLTQLLIPVMESLVELAFDFTDGLEMVSKGISMVTDPAKTLTAEFEAQRSTVNDLESNFVPLIDRFEELNNKSNRTNEEQAELEGLIKDISEVVPSAVTEFDNYGKALGISADAARDFVKLQKEILETRNAEAIEAQTKALQKAQEEQEIFQNTLNGVAGGLTNIKKEGNEFFEIQVKGGKVARTELRKLSEEEISDIQTRLEDASKAARVAQAELKLLRGESIAPTTTEEDQQSPTEEEIKAQEQRAKKLSDQRNKQNEEAKKQLQKLQEDIAKLEEGAELSQLSKDEQEIQRIRNKYQEQIDLANELAKRQDDIGMQAAQQVIALENALDAEISAIRSKQAEERIAQEQKEIEERLQIRQDAQDQENELFFQQNQEAREREKELREQINEELLSENELELEQLRKHFEDMITEAEQFGIDTTDLRRIQGEELLALQMAQNENSLEEDRKTNEERLKDQQKAIKATGDLFSGLGKLLANSLDEQAKESSSYMQFQKLLTVAQIAVDTAKAISSLTANSQANPANAGTFNVAGALQFAAGIAQILANIAQARSVLSQANVPQKFMGGFHDVTGASDGKRYRANYLGRPSSGILPSGPQLILANERGPEYFVRHEDLNHPVVAHHVRMIENIRVSRQMQDGGFIDVSAPAPTQGQASTPPVQQADQAQLRASIERLNLAIDRLNANIEAGIPAVLEDDFLLDLQRRLALLDEVAGG